MLKRYPLFLQTCLLGILGMLSLSFDLRELATGTLDTSKRIQFIMPIFFAVMTGIFLYTARHLKRTSPGAKDPFP